MKIIRKTFIFGFSEPLPLKGFPPGKTRIRIRADDWVRIYVKDNHGIREWVVEEQDGFWIPGFQQGANLRL
jgi:hypothetical protein